MSQQDKSVFDLPELHEQEGHRLELGEKAELAACCRPFEAWVARVRAHACYHQGVVGQMGGSLVPAEQSRHEHVSSEQMCTGRRTEALETGILFSTGGGRASDLVLVLTSLIIFKASLVTLYLEQVALATAMRG